MAKSEKHRLTKARKSAIESYSKQRSRIAKFIKRAEQRGYRFEIDFVPSKVSEIKSLSTQKIKSLVKSLTNLKPVTMYQKSTALSESGDIVSGTEKRKEERSEASKKAYQNRDNNKKRIDEINKQIQELEQEKQRLQQEQNQQEYDKFMPHNEPGFAEKQAKKDAENIKRLDTDKSFRELFQEGRLIIDHVYGMIDDVDSKHRSAAKHLRQVLDEQISTYGRDAVAMSVAHQSQDFLESCEIALRYNSGDSRHDNAIIHILVLIKGEIPTAEELKQIEDEIEQDAYTDFDE
jgi:hypothetical protein